MAGALTKVAVEQRLDYVDQMLLASGWVRDEMGWLAPSRMRKLLAREVGAGHVKRSLAVAAQVQFDEACLQEFGRPEQHIEGVDCAIQGACYGKIVFG